MCKQDEMIGYCGYNCRLCAARSDDPAIRQKLVEGWKKYFGHQQYTSENVKCEGCRGNGQIADKTCEVRPCARSKNIKSCVDCEQFPCEKIRRLACSMDGMLFYSYPETAKITEEEYNLCMRQFESISYLIGKMTDMGMLPEWLKKYYI